MHLGLTLLDQVEHILTLLDQVECSLTLTRVEQNTARLFWIKRNAF